MKTLIPQPLEWIHTAPVRVNAIREMSASAAEVFAALADHESWPVWFTSISRVERFGDLDEGTGSKRRVFVGKVRFEEEFVVWEPDKQWGFTIIGASIGFLRSMNELVTIQEIGPGRVRVTYAMGIDPKPLLTPLVRAVRRQLRKKLEQALDNLGAHVEKGRS